MIYEYPSNQSDKILKQNRDKVLKFAEKNNKTVNNNAKSTLKNIEHTTKAVFRCFFKFLLVLCSKNKNNNFFVAFIIAGGIGDVIRQISVITEFINMFPNIIIDIYTNRKLYFLFKGIKNIRCLLEIDLIALTKNKYDMVCKSFLEYQSWKTNQKIILNNNKKTEILKIKRNLHSYKNKYFSTINFPINSDLHYVAMQKAQAGVDNIENISLGINYSTKFGKFKMIKNLKYITFNYGFGSNGTNVDPKCWDVNHWRKFLSILKMKLKNIKIVQVGVSNHYFEESFINTAKKTSFDELCTILKNSLLHIDIDGACTHISKALGTKSIVLFGPTCAKYLGYPENINITSSLCRDCYHFIDNTFWGKCVLGHEKSLCMDSISPEFVANKVLESIL